MTPLKKTGTVAAILVQGQKSHHQLLQNPLPFLLPTTHGCKEAMWHIFLMLNLPRGRVCALKQCKQKGLLGKTTCRAQLNFCSI